MFIYFLIFLNKGTIRYLSTLRPLIVGGLIKKRGLAIFPEEINGEGVNKWKWVNFVMQCLNRGVVNSWGGSINF